jgi:hypothetical protein
VPLLTLAVIVAGGCDAAGPGNRGATPKRTPTANVATTIDAPSRGDVAARMAKVTDEQLRDALYGQMPLEAERNAVRYFVALRDETNIDNRSFVQFMTDGQSEERGGGHITRVTFHQIKIDSSVIQNLSMLKHLAELFFRKSPITSTQLADLAGFSMPIKDLRFAEMDIEADVLTAAARFRNLHSISFRVVPLDREALEAAVAIPSLKSVTVTEIPLTEDDYRVILRRTDWDELVFDECQTIETSLAGLDQQTAIKALIIGQGTIGHGIVDSIGKLKTLELLWLRGSTIDDESLDKLASLSKLRDLELTDTKVTKAGLARIRQALPDCLVHADHLEE